MRRGETTGSRTPEREERIREVLRQRQDDLTLVLANIHDPHNVSAIYRSCDAFGVSRVRLFYTREPFPRLNEKSSGSARKWVESSRHDDIETLFDDLRREGMRVLATSFSPEAKPLGSWNFLEPTAIILGNEHSGAERELIDKADGELYIPMRGMIQSFNVSVAAAIILAEAARQRDEAGFYSRPWPDTEEFEARRLEWLKK
ncbi:MAG: RNA methyltransferase [Desulfovibrio sp.]|nr:RNA methyltransferase [Desulfovibrio sp.]